MGVHEGTSSVGLSLSCKAVLGADTPGETPSGADLLTRRSATVPMISAMGIEGPDGFSGFDAIQGRRRR